jgi:hypothetical protein
MYRLCTPDAHKPLFVANSVIDNYPENRVDTLHMKNLLHLGEGRYLTTLLLKHFPLSKTQFVRDAKAFTVAPFCCLSVAGGSTRRFIIWESWCFRIGSVDPVVSRCGSSSSST